MLPEEKYGLINSKQKGGSTTLNGDIINNLPEKVIDLYERMLLERDKKIEKIENQLKHYYLGKKRFPNLGNSDYVLPPLFATLGSIASKNP